MVSERVKTHQALVVTHVDELQRIAFIPNLSKITDTSFTHFLVDVSYFGWSSFLSKSLLDNFSALM